MRAYEHLNNLRAGLRFRLAHRIAIHEALARKRRRGRMEELDALPNGDAMSILKSSAPNPEAGTAASEARALLEQAIDQLPEAYRTVVMLREVEEMSVAETAESMGVSDAVVKTRLHRAHAMLRKELYARAKGRATDLYQLST